MVDVLVMGVMDGRGIQLPPTKRDMLEIDEERERDLGVEVDPPGVQAVKAGVGGKVDQSDSGVPGPVP